MSKLVFFLNLKIHIDRLSTQEIDSELSFNSKNHVFSIKQLITNRNYVALVISFGSLVGFFNCYATQMEQFMCSRGYSNDDSGYAVTILISIGLVGSIIAGIITDITGRLEEVAKICNILLLCCKLFAISTNYLCTNN